MDGSHRAFGVDSAQLQSIIERIESLRAEQKASKECEKEVFAEAKAMGFMVGPLRKVVNERAADPNKLAEEAAWLEMYKSALGMD